MIDYYIIGSISQEKEIKRFAKEYSNMGFKVEYVKSEPDKSFPDLIHQCYNNILKASIIIAFTKPDGTFGDGVWYEIIFAKMFNRKVYSYNILDDELTPISYYKDDTNDLIDVLYKQCYTEMAVLYYLEYFNNFLRDADSIKSLLVASLQVAITNGYIDEEIILNSFKEGMKI